MDVSIVIPNWNGRSLLEKNLPSVVAAAKNKKNKIVEIIVVDDKSTDDSVDYLKQSWNKDIKLIMHKVNRGFSAACNTGVRSAKGDLVCLLNTDVIPEPTFLEAVVENFKEDLVFGVSLHEKGYGFSKGAFENGFIIHRPGKESNKKQSTFWINGGSGVFRRTLWLKLGGFDEKIITPFYWEDTDLGYRALKRGYKLLWEPNARVLHKHESVINASNFSRYRLVLIKERNYLLFNWKNLTSDNLLRKHRAGLFKRILRHPGYIKVVIAALTKYPAVRAARQKERKAQVLSDEAIFQRFQ